MSILIDLAFIFFARVTDVSLATIRVLMVMRAHRLVAATLGFFEIIIYILALNRGVNHLDTPLNLVVYALGFAMGTIVGSLIEDRLAVGFLLAEVIPKGDGEELARELRKHKFGVTLLRGEGRDGPRNVLRITLQRKKLPILYKLLDELSPNAFITIFDARRTIGGFFQQNK